MGEDKGHAGVPHRAGEPERIVPSLSPNAPGASSVASPEMRLDITRRAIRRLLHLWFFLRRGMTMGVRAAVLDDEGRVFLVRHSYVPGWQLPGGGIERGQDARAALEAELREEGNIVLEGEPSLFAVYFNTFASNRDHVLLYIVRAFRQTHPRTADHEIVEAGFFPLDALPVGTTPATLLRLKEISGLERPASRW